MSTCSCRGIRTEVGSDSSWEEVCGINGGGEGVNQSSGHCELEKV
jgi:hypothetical protein